MTGARGANNGVKRLAGHRAAASPKRNSKGERAANGRFGRGRFGHGRGGRGHSWRVLVWLGLVLTGAVALLAGPSGQAQTAEAQTAEGQGASKGSALVLTVRGVIGPALGLYIRQGIEQAEDSHDLVILEMDTPGGLDTSMREINQDILASRVPVVTYVSPSGSRAASAGTYILYASHVSAMTPGTTLGAATPIQLGGGGNSGERDQENTGSGNQGSLPSIIDDLIRSADGDGQEADQSGQDSSGGANEGDAGSQPTPSSGDQNEQTNDGASQRNLSAAERKAVNDAAAYIRGLAQLRGRNAEWAERAVREGVSLSAREALRIDVIDVVAQDLQDLLGQIDGRTVSMEGGGEVTLDTDGITITRLEMSWIQELLSIITNPSIAFVLMQLGVLGLIIELYNPGAIFPGVVGLICLILGLTALAVLPVSYGGLALLLVGMLFMLLELFVASGGILAVFGVIAFGFGAFFLFDTDVPEFRLSPFFVIASTAVMAAVVFGVVGYSLNALRRQVVTGREALIGMKGIVVSWEGNSGYVRLDGENWQAVSDRPLRPGQEVEAVAIEDLVLKVRPISR